MAQSNFQQISCDGVSLIPRGPRTVGFPTADQISEAIGALSRENAINQARQLADEGVTVYPSDEGVLAAAGRLALVCDDTRRAAWLMEQLISIRRAAARFHQGNSKPVSPRQGGNGKPMPGFRQALAARAE